MFENIKSLIHAGPAAKPVVVAPAPKPAPQVAEPAPAVVAPSVPASEPVSAPISEEPTIVEYEPEPVVGAVAKLSKEPTIVEYTPEPVAVAPQETPLVDPTGKLRAYVMADGALVAVTAESEDSLAHLKAEDKRPVSPEEEARVDLPQRSAGRISFLTATYESEKEDPAYPERREKRMKNDLARALHARPRSEFDPETTKAAESIKKWLA